MRHVPVAIIGGGPVGMVLAMNLATFGVPVLLVNIEPSSRWHPKGSTHNARTMEHYRRLGISKELRKVGLPADHSTDVGYFTTLNGWELARIPMPSEQEKMAKIVNADPTDQIPEPLFRCNQMYVERRLFEHIQTLPSVEARYGWRCVEIQEDVPRIRLTIEEVETGSTEQIECDYLAGCDGGRSMVRKYLGYVFEGEPPVDQPYAGGATVSTHLRAPSLYREVLKNPCWQYWTVNPNVRSNLVTLDGEGEFLFNTRFQSADDSPDHAFIARRFQESVGESVAFEIIDHWPWTAGHAHVADHFGRGPILLAGDAVHLFTPTGGFGMNTGVDDTANLGWKIAAMVQGWGGPGLLASYELERRPIAIRNTNMSKQFSLNVGKVPVVPDILDHSPEGDSARLELGAHLSTFAEEFASIGVQLGARYDDSPIIEPDGTPPPDDPAIYVPTSCPGGRAPHFYRPDRSSLFDHLGVGFTLLHLHGEHEFDTMVQSARTRAIPFQIMRDAQPEVRKLYECDLALIRPDQHVAWRGNRLPYDCDGLLARVTGW